MLIRLMDYLKAGKLRGIYESQCEIAINWNRRTSEFLPFDGYLDFMPGSGIERRTKSLRLRLEIARHGALQSIREFVMSAEWDPPVFRPMSVLASCSPDRPAWRKRPRKRPKRSCGPRKLNEAGSSGKKTSHPRSADQSDENGFRRRRIGTGTGHPEQKRVKGSWSRNASHESHTDGRAGIERNRPWQKVREMHREERAKSDGKAEANGKAEGEQQSVIKLRLYVAGQTPKSLAALSNLQRICAAHFDGKYDLEVIDLMKHRNWLRAIKFWPSPRSCGICRCPSEKLLATSPMWIACSWASIFVDHNVRGWKSQAAFRKGNRSEQ